ncbi:MAG: glycosyltransferase family 1 protein [Chloroflexota bacterium]
MHFAIDGRLLAFGTGGIARYTSCLARAVMPLLGRDRLTMLRSRRQSAEALAGLSSQPLWTPPHHRLEQVTLPLEVGRIGPTLLHSPDFVPPLRRTFKSVITVHDVGFLKYPETLTPASRDYYQQTVQAVRNAEATIAVSWNTARDVCEVAGTAADRLWVIHNGVEARFADPVSDAQMNALRAHRGLEAPYVLYVGTIEPRKNLITLLRACARARERLGLRLVIAGRRGWLYEPFFEAVRELKLAEHCTVIEDLTDAELPVLYRGASVFVYPSLYEGFGLPALEAMAGGTPTVVSDNSSLPEVVGDGALLFETLDADSLAHEMERAIHDTALRSRLSAAGRARAATFTWERAARQTLRLYRAVGGT